jgi:phenylacetate-CoA ligase
MKIFHDIDKLTVDAIKKIQDELLFDMVCYTYEMSVYYRKVFDGHGLSPTDINAVELLDKLPFTGKLDISKDNWAFLSVKREHIAEIVSTTGTTGEPIFIALTIHDIERLTYNEERSFGYTDAGRNDLFHIAVTCDNLFIAGIAYYRGLIRLGTSVVRIGPQNIVRHFDLIKKLKPNGIVAIPSFLFYLIRRAHENGLDVKKLGIEKIVLIGDSIRNIDFSANTLGRLIEDSFGEKCYSTYGITEGQVSFCECEFHRGFHSHPDLVIVEIVDDNGKSLKDNEIGELVITPLQLQGMPLIRYKTGDITFKISSPCLCGRNSIRIGPILGRKHQRLKVSGVTLYPKTIENTILDVKDIINYQIEVYTGNDQTDHIILRVGTYRNDKSFKSFLIDSLRARAKVTPEIEIESPEELEKRLFEGGSRKAIIFKDRRIKLYE